VGYPLWSFAPLAVLLVWRRRSIGAAATVCGRCVGLADRVPIGFIIAELYELFLRDRPRRPNSRAVCWRKRSQRWRERTERR
jgi:hypothetical protein